MGPVLATGDLIQFTAVGSHIIPMIIAPLPLIGTSHVCKPTPVCVEGDELPPYLQIPMPYMDGAFTIPGIGTINLTLPALNLSQIISHGGKAVLLMGVPFSATFDVTVPAIQPSAVPIPDVNLSKDLLVTYIPINLPIHMAVM